MSDEDWSSLPLAEKAIGVSLVRACVDAHPTKFIEYSLPEKYRSGFEIGSANEKDSAEKVYNGMMALLAAAIRTTCEAYLIFHGANGTTLSDDEKKIATSFSDLRTIVARVVSLMFIDQDLDLNSPKNQQNKDRNQDFNIYCAQLIDLGVKSYLGPEKFGLDRVVGEISFVKKFDTGKDKSIDKEVPYTNESTGRKEVAKVITVPYENKVTNKYPATNTSRQVVVVVAHEIAPGVTIPVVIRSGSSIPETNTY